MVLVGSLQSFAEQAEALFVADPVKTRYILKYDHSKGKLHLKCTDDVSTVQYTTDQQSDLRKIEKLNGRLIHWMATGEEPPEEAVSEPTTISQPQRPAKKQSQPQEQSGRSKKTRRKA